MIFVATNNYEKLWGFGTAGEQEPGKLAEAAEAKVADLAPMEVANGAIEAGEQPESLGSDVDEDATPVGVLAAAGDEAALIEPVEETGDVGVAGDHAGGDLAAEEAVGGAAQDAEDVVLVGGEFLGLEQVCDGAREQVGGALQLEEGELFGEGCGAVSGCGARRDAHTFATILVVTNNVKCDRYGDSGCARMTALEG